MLLVGKSGKAAGDFSIYENTCDLLKDGWKFFRPEKYDFKLVDAATGDEIPAVDCSQ